MNNSGRNAQEGIKLLEKLGQGGYSRVHGDTIHHILNLYWVTRLMDLKGLEFDNNSKDFYVSLLGNAMMGNSKHLADSLAQHLKLDKNLHKSLTQTVEYELGTSKPLTDKLLGVVST